MRLKNLLGLFGVISCLIGFVDIPSGWANDTILHSFGASGDGSFPYDSLVTDGTTYVYGTTELGGQANHGMVFRFDILTRTYKVLHSFGVGNVVNVDGNQVPDGETPQGSLVLSGSTLYGMTHVGGTAGGGVVFSMNTEGTVYTILHTFGDGAVANDGLNPYGSLLLSGSTLYGMTPFGGSAGKGVVFSTTTGGTTTILHSFGDGAVRNDGENPGDSLIISEKGSTLYGMTGGGGAAGVGVVFSITTGGKTTILHSFGEHTVVDVDGKPVPDGTVPFGFLSMSGSVLYGMTTSGGVYDDGVVFKIENDGVNPTILHSFGGTIVNKNGTEINDGSIPNPSSSLLLSGSTLYGMTSSGGGVVFVSEGHGVVFEIDTDGKNYNILHSFPDPAVHSDGSDPIGSLIPAGPALYGVTYEGGSHNDGAIFSLSLASQTYSISGKVTDSEGSPLKGVRMALSGASSATTKTASDGTYSFSGLLNGSYTITPSLAGYTFNPTKATPKITNKDITGADFTATPLYSISGKVTLKAGGAPLDGVTVTLSGAAKGAVKTDSEGVYSFGNLRVGAYYLTAALEGYTLSPSKIKVTLNKSLTGQDFSGTKR
jgi:uncharacterized repeat protein (TIGR03803 family)